jgi:hypothetical protein
MGATSDAAFAVPSQKKSRGIALVKQQICVYKTDAKRMLRKSCDFFLP